MRQGGGKVCNYVPRRMKLMSLLRRLEHVSLDLFVSEFWPEDFLPVGLTAFFS